MKTKYSIMGSNKILKDGVEMSFSDILKDLNNSEEVKLNETALELQKEVKSIRSKVKGLFGDKILKKREDVFGCGWWSPDDEDDAVYLVKKVQAGILQEFFDLLQKVSWALSLNNHKKIEYEKGDLFKKSLGNRMGSPVKISPCGEEYNNKTYFGILLGDLPLSMGLEIKEDTLIVKRSFYNPAIFIPELKKVVYGCESFWGEIDSEDDLKNLITAEVIENVWYMKLLKRVGEDGN